jgi:hypothetical protein
MVNQKVEDIVAGHGLRQTRAAGGRVDMETYGSNDNGTFPRQQRYQKLAINGIFSIQARTITLHMAPIVPF